MTEHKTVVLTLRVTDAVMGALTARADAERRPVRTLAAMMLADALFPPKLVAKVLTGPAPTEFPRREVHLRGQSSTKDKK